MSPTLHATRRRVARLQRLDSAASHEPPARATVCEVPPPHTPPSQPSSRAEGAAHSPSWRVFLVAAVATAAAAYSAGYACALPPLPPGPPPPDRRMDDHRLVAPAAARFDAYAARITHDAGYHHVSVCSRPHPKFELLQQTAAWHGDAVVPLGMGDARFQRWGVGFGVKLEMVQRWLGGAGGPADDDVVLFSDAFDVLLMAGRRDIKAAYLRAARLAMAREEDPAAVAAGKPPRVPTIVFSTERYCWPDAGRAGAYPPTDRAYEFAFLNSGTYVGRAGDLAAAMATLNYTIAEDDQRYWTSVYLASRHDYSMPRIVLDHEADVFVCMSGYGVRSDLEFNPATRRYKFTRAPGQPVVIHFNNAKTEIDPFFAALQGRWCPETQFGACTVAYTFLPAVFALLVGVTIGRALYTALGVAASCVRWVCIRRGDAGAPISLSSGNITQAAVSDGAHGKRAASGDGLCGKLR